MERLRAAVIGTGVFGTYHARCYYENPLTDLVAVVNRTEEKGKKVAEQYGAKWYPTVEALISQEKFDIASVCTSEDMHLQQGRLLCEAGKKILMEKPLGRTLEEIDELIKVVDENNSFMAVDYILHNDPRFSEIKRKCDANEFGDHIYYFARRRNNFATAQYYGPWTDILISTGIHDIDLMCWFNGSRPIRVYAEAVTKKCSEIGTWDAVLGTIVFENGAIGSLETSWALPEGLESTLETSFHLVGTEQAAIVNGANNGFSVISNQKTVNPDLTHWPALSNGLQGDLKASIDAFVHGVLNKEAPFQTVKMAKTSHQIVFAMRESIKTHMAVEI